MSQAFSINLLDLNAAFDTINHNQLLFVLKNTFRLNYKVLEWLHSYLDSHTFSVIAAGSQLQVHNLDVGVPQGLIFFILLFILFILLFILFTKDLQDVITVHFILLFILFTKDLQDVITVHNMHFHFYADDTQVFLNFQPLRSEFIDQDCLVKLQNCLSNINVWMHNRFLKLNINKTDVMEISLYPSLMP